MQAPLLAALTGWQGAACWRILESHFDNGLRFLHVWNAWQKASQRPRVLHVVTLAAQAPSVEVLRKSDAGVPELAALAKVLADALAQQAGGLEPGFQRLSLSEGHVLLTLCIGPVQRMLREQQFLADAVCLHNDGVPWDGWQIKALTRCCRRGTVLALPQPSASLHHGLTQAGFELAAEHNVGHYNPRWRLSHTRSPWAVAPALAPTPSCVVIGAGLAGATVASALARRGWQVQVLDSAAQAASGASGLPVGLMVPQVSRDDSPRSRLSRSGIRLTWQHLQELLVPGQDWQASGVLQLGPEGGVDGVARWHPAGAWVKPAQLVNACLNQPGIRLIAGAHVATLQTLTQSSAVDDAQTDGRVWAACDAQGNVIATASHVVLAVANGTGPLVQNLQAQGLLSHADVARLPALQGSRGQVSWALAREVDRPVLPPFPVNGLGSFISGVPMAGGLAWFAGAGYEPVTEPPASVCAKHRANQGRLQRLLPAVAALLESDFEEDIQAWAQTRCTAIDRLPLVGPLSGDTACGLWTSTGMGSRGLSYAVLCAELLAAQLHAEPLPLEASLARHLYSLRAESA